MRAGLHAEQGSAALEFLGVGVILLVPLLYLVLALGSVQSAVMATTSAAREAVRVVAADGDRDRVADAVAVAVRDFGIEPDRVRTRVDCDDASCARRDTIVVAAVRTEVSLPFVPAVFGLDRALVVPVESEAAQRIDRFGGSG
ncbi:TadE family protein [Microbacteriaceae bacterium VKM Ac-2854]|nr:TadE family protein [Microbacteriaceae bacterium VKM Ac-2854]